MSAGAGAASTLIDVVQRRADERPDATVCAFLRDGESDRVALTYAELSRRARSIGARLQQEAAAGDRALILQPPGLEFVEAFFGALFGGLIPVPTYPPDPARLDRTLSRLLGIVRDAQPAVILTTTAIASGSIGLLQPAIGAEPRWIATDGGTDESALASWKEPPISGEDIALLQYSSGTTGAPRGVMLTHRNLLHNSALIAERFGHSERSHGVIWLPPYHDMGLIGGILQPVFLGFSVTLMSPLSFLSDPLRWLRVITRERATTSGGPNFAYDLCVRRIGAADLAGLDLSSWDLAFCGAEPIRPAVLDAFAEKFAPVGFRREAFYPCYGLAEATLFVSGGSKRSVPVVRRFDGNATGSNPEAGRFHAGRAVVGCGSSSEDQQVVIVDPDSRVPCPPGEVGEIWIAGPSVGKGYWRDPERTAEIFHARASGAGDGEQRFLRSGDLGFLEGRELFVTGRLEDLIIIGGRNHHPQDIEATLERSHPVLRPGFCAAFSVDSEEGEQLVVAAEVRDPLSRVDREAVVQAIRRAVSVEHGVAVDSVALLERGAIPMTSSGKIRRAACREEFLRSRSGERGSDWVYRIEWRPAELPRSGSERTDGARRWLIFVDSRGIGDRLADLLVARGDSCVRVYHEPSGEPASSGERVHVEPGSEADLRDVVARWVRPGVELQGVIYAWGADAELSPAGANSDFERSHALACSAPIHLVKALALSASIENPKLWLVTAGAHAVAAGDAVAVAQAPLPALRRTIGFEHPAFRCRGVDLDPITIERSPESMARLLLEELFAEDEEDQVVFRSGVRFVERLVRGIPGSAGLDAPGASPVRPGRTYLVTGGCGFIGLHLARWLVDGGATDLVLVGRTPPSDAAGRAIRALRERGARVSVHQVDVARSEQVAELLREIRSDHARLGGIVHLAGSFDDREIIELDEGRLREVMAGRARGAWNLHVQTAQESLDFFALFSSAVSVLGSAGQAAFAASNAFLDALAHVRHAAGAPAISVNWGPWGEPDAAGSDVIQRISPEQGLGLLARLLRTDLPQVVVLPCDLEELLKFYPRAGKLRIFDEIGGTRSPVALQEYERGDLGTEYVAPATEPERVVAGVLRRALAIDRVGVRDDFFELGGDSIMAGGVIGRVNGIFGVNLALQDLIDAFTIERLVSLIEAQRAPRQAERAGEGT